MQPTDIVLKTYTGEPLAPEGVIKVQANLYKQTAELPLYVVKVDAPPLFGREWLGAIRLNWKELKTVYAVQLRKKTSPRECGIKATVTLKPDSMSKLCPPCDGHLCPLTSNGG